MIWFQRPLLFLLALGLVLSAPAATPARAGEPECAGCALPARASEWPAAIERYRALLRQDPGRTDVLLPLARVLSWSKHYGESLTTYQRYLEAHPDHSEARVERAEVLSWAGRYPEAERAFGELLAERPDDPRLLRGMARVHSWSGRTAKADDHYRRALAQEDDPEAREEWEELRSAFRPRVEMGSGFLDDDADFFRFESFLRAETWLDLDTRVFGRIGRLDIRRERSSDGTPLLGGAPIRQRDRAGDYSLGVERRIDQRWRAGLELGWRDWRHADDRAYVRSHLDFELPNGGHVGLAVSREDHTDRSRSREAVADEVRGLYTAMSLWSPLGPGWEAYFQAEGGWLNDDNRMRGAFGQVSYRPWQDRDTTFALSGRVSSYADERLEYYTPNADTGALFSIRDTFEMATALAFELGVRGGWGYAHNEGSRDEGPEWGTSAALVWKPGVWSLRLEGDHARTQREGSYQATRSAITIGREF